MLFETMVLPFLCNRSPILKFNSEVVPLSDEGITDVDIYRDCLRTLHSQAVVEAKTNFVPNRVLGASPPDILTSWKSAASVCPYHSRPVAFWSLLAFEQLQGPHHQRHIRCLSGVWSGTTLRRASVQLPKPSDATYSARPVGQPGCGRRLPQPGQLTIGEELLGYQNNNHTSLKSLKPVKTKDSNPQIK